MGSSERDSGESELRESGCAPKNKTTSRLTDGVTRKVMAISPFEDVPKFYVSLKLIKLIVENLDEN